MPTTIEKAQENFTVGFEPAHPTTSDTAPRTDYEKFSVIFKPVAYFSPGDVIYQDFSVFVWTPVQLVVCEQIYKKVHFAQWTKYVETEFAEFQKYQLHRKTNPFIPVIDDPATLLFETTDADIIEYYDFAADADLPYYYAIIVMLDDGRYCVSDSVKANKYPVWGVEWPDVLLFNDGSDNINQNSVYGCESTIAVDPEGADVIYRFQYNQSFSVATGLFNFVYGANPYPNFVDCGDRRIVISIPSAKGVRVNGELWTCAGSDIDDLLAYGPSDKVYIYDEIMNFLIFGDNTHGLEPGFSHPIECDISSWIDIETIDDPTENLQDWYVAEIAIGDDYCMRVFPLDNILNGKRGASGIGTTFRLLPELAPPILVEPYNLSTINSYFPRFVFYGIALYGNPVKFKFQVASDPGFTDIIQEFNQVTTPGEWIKAQYNSTEMVYFVPSQSKPIVNQLPLSKHGPYYWRAALYDSYFGSWSSWSGTYRYNVEGATFKWKIGRVGLEVAFMPDKGGWSVETIQAGREGVEKKIFRVKFAPMREDQMEILKAEFDRRIPLSLWDNMANNFMVYWGESERALSGTAFFPDTPAFGIEQKNYIPGALIYGGEAVFTEI